MFFVTRIKLFAIAIDAIWVSKIGVGKPAGINFCVIDAFIKAAWGFMSNKKLLITQIA